MRRRIDGELQPGIRWGPFTLRIPFYHFRAEWPEMVQGLIVAGATGMALIKILNGFNITFEVALAVVVVQAVLIATAPLVFGDPYCHGWVTPAIPLVLAEMARLGASPDASPENTREVIQYITAFTFLCAGLFLVMGLTGFGRTIVERIPPPLKAGIIFGAAVSAFLHEFQDVQHSSLREKPISCTTAVCVCLVLMYALPVARLKKRVPCIAILVGLGLAPGFVAAMLVGAVTGELEFAPHGGLEIPPFGEMWRELSPFSAKIGWPSLSMFVSMLPFSFVVYIIAFGDVITGNELLREASRHRPDERIDVDPTRIHLNMGIRNAIHGVLAGPFPPVHGALWTGVHVVVTERYKQGRAAMDSLYGGIAAYYLWGVPVLFFIRPVTSFLEPMLPVALSMTLLLTGFACGYVAMAIPRNHLERGIAITTGMVLAVFGAWQGLAVGLVMTVIMIGRPSQKST